MGRRTRPAVRRAQAQLAFEALAIEGGLLSPDWLARAAQLQAGQQSEAEYRVPKGLVIRDEIGRYWRIAQAVWSEFAQGRAAGADPAFLAERFVLGMLRDAFGFSSLAPIAPLEIAERSYPIGFAALGGRIPVVLAPAGLGVDAPVPAYVDGARRRSAFGLAQEFLNASDDAMWGVVSDGVTLRIVRDNASMTRPAWIEADLGRIFTEERYADFAVFWLLAHETRFGRAEQKASECPLEVWREAGREEGTRAREHLRTGVEEAILALGGGFLAHPDNTALRNGLHTGALTRDELFQQLLRLVYRLIFLVTVEERGVLHPEGSDEAARKLYANGYSVRGLRERSVKRSAHDRFPDLWEALKIVLRGVATGEPRLALPALAGLFAASQCPALDGAKLENRALLLAVFRLTWLRDASGLARVNWRDMGPEELGSVYESLLELVPVISEDGRKFAFASSDESKGNARKTSGSYYTPDSLVQVLLDSALEPVIADAKARHPERPIDALLSLSIVDPACGSGHFLLAAARRLAAHVARLQANGTPSAPEYRHALRQVVGRCLYGVDLNPMAVELCKVSLWMEAVEPGLPLTFLDAHIQHGNALLGTTPELMAKGIPDDAWSTIEGDDKKVASALKKQNKKEAKEEAQIGMATTWSDGGDVGKAVADLEGASDADLDALGKKVAKWDEIRASAAFQREKLIADAWCAAFVWPKQAGPLATAAPTNALWSAIQGGQGTPPALTVATINELATQYSFFHWHLAFPQVFGKGGFDVVLGNPPWDMNEVKDNEFFAQRYPEILAVKSAKEKQSILDTIAANDKPLFSEYSLYVRKMEGERHALLTTGRFPRSAVGRLNLYRLFIEHACCLIVGDGRLGMVVPSGFASDAFAQPHFVSIQRRIRRFLDFENSGGLFDSVHRAFRFALLVVGSAEPDSKIDFVFFAHQATDLADKSRHVFMGPTDLAAINPLTQTAPLFRSVRDQELTLALHQRGPVLADEGAQGWHVKQVLMFMMNAAMKSHRSADELARTCQLDGNKYREDTVTWLPMYEGKMVGLYDHRASGIRFDPSNRVRRNQPEYLSDDDKGNPHTLVLPLFWVPQADVEARAADLRKWRLAVKDVTASTNERTCIAAILPEAALTDSVPWIQTGSAPTLVACLLANLNAHVCDFAARQKVAGLHLRGHYLAQLPVLSPGRYSEPVEWLNAAPITWLVSRVLELSYTAWDLEPFAKDVGWDGPPFRWNPARRFVLRCELDAAFFHLYGLSRDDADYILDTFPIVQKNDEKAHGEYRTKRVILEIYDAMAGAARTGRRYVTRLDPPPADPRVAHPRPGKVIPFPRMPATPAPQPARIPEWGPDLLPAVAAKYGSKADSWSTLYTGNDLLRYALAAVLRVLPWPWSGDDVGRAVMGIVWPNNIATHLDARTAAEFRRLVGKKALGEPNTPIGDWVGQVRLAVTHKILAITPDGWRAGADIDDADEPALTARAAVVVAWMMSAERDDAVFTEREVLLA